MINLHLLANTLTCKIYVVTSVSQFWSPADINLSLYCPKCRRSSTSSPVHLLSEALVAGTSDETLRGLLTLYLMTSQAGQGQ